MQTVFIEVEHSFNWGKFCVAKFDAEEWSRISVVSDIPKSLLRQRGWGEEHIWVLDLETGEGACFRVGGLAEADLQKHAIWCCPMYVYFLDWLYKQDLSDLSKLPKVVKLGKDVPGAMYGHRRTGGGEAIKYVIQNKETLAFVDTAISYKTSITDARFFSSEESAKKWIQVRNIRGCLSLQDKYEIKPVKLSVEFGEKS